MRGGLLPAPCGAAGRGCHVGAARPHSYWGAGPLPPPPPPPPPCAARPRPRPRAPLGVCLHAYLNACRHKDEVVHAGHGGKAAVRAPPQRNAVVAAHLLRAACGVRAGVRRAACWRGTRVLAGDGQRCSCGQPARSVRRGPLESNQSNSLLAQPLQACPRSQGLRLCLPLLLGTAALALGHYPLPACPLPPHYTVPATG
jgi:hypothetical protein